MVNPLDNLLSTASGLLGGASKNAGADIFSTVLNQAGGLFGASNAPHVLDKNNDGYLSKSEIIQGAKQEKVVGGLEWKKIFPNIDTELTREDYAKVAKRYNLPENEFDAIATAGDNKSSTISRKDLDAYIAQQNNGGKGISTSKIAMGNATENLPLLNIFRGFFG